MKNFVYKKVDNLELKATYYPAKQSRALVFYLHGGGFIYGNRDDLPQGHIESFTSANLALLSLDYRLAPEVGLDLILEDVHDGINYFLDNLELLGLDQLPFFLWGRSAGAYLALRCWSKLIRKPLGILSYYGYGFLEDYWYEKPSNFYLKYPLVEREKALKLVEASPLSQADIFSRFPLYLYSRQEGLWLNLITGKNRESLNEFSLKSLDPEEFPPVFLAHSFSDQDVPFKESQKLSKLIKDSSLFTSSSKIHDFDSRDLAETKKLLEVSVNFIKDKI